MKLSIRLAFAALVAVSVLNSPQLLAAPSNIGSTPKVVAAQKVPRITRDNFIWLSLLWWGPSNSSQTTTISVTGNTLSLHAGTTGPGGFGGFGGGLGPTWGGLSGFGSPFYNINDGVQTVMLSNNQLAALIGLLNKMPLIATAKNDNNPSDMILTLDFSDKNDKTQSFRFLCNGDAAPKGNAQFATALLALAREKFPNTNIELPPASVPPTANATGH